MSLHNIDICEAQNHFHILSIPIELLFLNAEPDLFRFIFRCLSLHFRKLLSNISRIMIGSHFQSGLLFCLSLISYCMQYLSRSEI